MSIYVCVVYVCYVYIYVSKNSKVCTESSNNPKKIKNFKKVKKIQKIQKIPKNSKNFKKSKNSTNPKKFEFFIFFIFSFWNNFFSLWNLEDLRKPHRVNPGGIGFLFFSSFFWHIKRIFSTSYAKVMAVLRFFSGFCKKGQNSYFKISIRTRQ